MNILGIIPARFKSSRFEGKPLATILGKTLIQRTYENALNSHLFKSLVVATDDARIYEHVLSFGADAIMTTSHCQTGTDRIAEAVRSNTRFDAFDIVVNIQGDEPCLEPEVIEKVIDALKTSNSAVMSTAVMKLESEEDAANPSIVKCVFDQSGRALYFSRALIPSGKIVTFNKKNAYYRHLGIYAFRREFLLKYAFLSETPLQKAEDLEQLKVLEHGFQIQVAIVNSESIGVDVKEDIKKVEILLCKSKQNTYL